MRQVLIEAARRRNANKRGGTDAVTVTFDESMMSGRRPTRDLIALDAALDELGRLEPRQAMMVEGRIFLEDLK